MAVGRILRAGPTLVLTLSSLIACGGSGNEGGDATGAITDGGTEGSSATDTDGGDGDGSTTGDETGPKFDTPDGDDTDGADDGGEGGCEKVDFLFVIDNSESMFDEQQNLVNSFPGFISTIQDTLMAQDYQILVTSSDAKYRASNVECLGSGCSCEYDPDCCFVVCHDPDLLPNQCNGSTCQVFDKPDCGDNLGDGRLDDLDGAGCGIVGGNRYMTDAQPDLGDTFACVALVGDEGDNHERSMEAMTEAVGPLTQPAACNEGFVRDDAILVVTFVTDEADNNKSEGDPMDWKNALVAAKNGNEDAIVMLGLIGDSDQPNPVCPGEDPNNGDGAQPAPRLRELIESFGERGFAGSVCADDYTPFFADAVSLIDAACDDFVPEG